MIVMLAGKHRGGSGGSEKRREREGGRKKGRMRGVARDRERGGDLRAVIIWVYV